MKFIFLAITVFSIFSCIGSARVNQPDVKVENTVNQPDNSVENAVKITGRIVIFGDGRNTFAGITDENDVQYAIYPPSVEEELGNLQGHLIEFTVIFVEEQTYGSLFLRGGTVTPVSWEIIR